MIRPNAAALAVAGALVMHAPHAEACAGCRNPSLAVGRANEGPLPSGALRAGLTVTGTTVHVVHEAGCADPANCDEVPIQPAHLHDQHLYPLELRLAAEYALNENFGLALQLPFRLIATSVEYTTPDGAPYEPLDEGVHHRNETLAGLGDPWLLFRAGAHVDRLWLAARAGVSLPLGSTEENPFELGDRGLRHQHIQFGSGTFDPIAILELMRSFDGIELQAFVQGQLPLYENRHGYHAPWRVYGGASAGTLLAGKLFGALGVEAFHEDAEEWDGDRRQDGNLGRTELLGAATLSQAFGATEVTLDVRAPFYRQIVTGDEPPGTLSSPVTLSLGVAHTFGGT